ncbi:Predicted protein [Taphrina deformans PYCC 5710]|uniref:VASt domain-containing protein n=1 Tax=Taphrina deformans (strain PYCC 5710 / ATCC 11124 / CBS 356.35 / IMI 108563 / JCM 9778 / NBRC 8474) TaxID=1097556 RepID=R4XA99_TAPDE|nr:Predicted protein [Taphrina deformans PYCC 5710]|eukprot:CCG82728.1 Predicted protein [Taphrina deformans PYCC 5710]
MSLTEGSVHRKSSIKSKLRHISLNRHHKAAHFEEEKDESDLSPSLQPQTDSQVPEIAAMPTAVLEKQDSPDRARGRSQSRVSLEDKEQRIDSALSPHQGLSQPQLAKPILSTPAIGTNDGAPDDTANVNTPFAAIITNHGAAQDGASLNAVPAVATGGFLSSMYNAASNLGTVLGGANQRGVVRTKQSNVTGSRSSALELSAGSATHDDPSIQGSSHTPADVGNLSLKDMGLTDLVEEFEAKALLLNDPDYGCALQKEILVHGRMYVSESHICFNSNIFGWVTNLVIAFVDIIAVEKKSTAGIFPNAIQISTQQAKHVFASFISRDTTFDLIVNIWRLTHPLIQTTANGVEVANTEGDDLYESDTNSSIGSEPEDLENESDSESETEPVQQAPRRASVNLKDSPNICPSRPVLSESPAGPTDYPGPSEHTPTEAPSLTDGTAFAKSLMDECFEAPLGKLFELIFGSDTAFMQDFLVSNQKLLDVVVGQFSDRAGKSVRALSYVKPLSGPIGPKQTRCLLEDTIEIKDFEKCVQIVQSTTSPDVPSGDAFVIKTRFSFMWGPRNTTRLVTNCTIEWSKNSWIKGPIEKASNSGQVQFMADLSEALKNHLHAGSGGSSDKKKKSKAKKLRSETANRVAAVPVSQRPGQDSAGGVLGALHGVAENINVSVLVVIFLFGMLLAMLRMQQSIRVLAENANKAASGGPLVQAQWQREETDLWAWLSARTMETSGTKSTGSSMQLPEASDMTSFQIQEALLQVQAQAAVLERARDLAAGAQYKSKAKSKKEPITSQ